MGVGEAVLVMRAFDPTADAEGVTGARSGEETCCMAATERAGRTVRAAVELGCTVARNRCTDARVRRDAAETFLCVRVRLSLLVRRMLSGAVRVTRPR